MWAGLNEGKKKNIKKNWEINKIQFKIKVGVRKTHQTRISK